MNPPTFKTSLGGWGYVIVIITVIIQCISHGMHMSSGILVSIIITRFRETLLTAGMNIQFLLYRHHRRR